MKERNDKISAQSDRKWHNAKLELTQLKEQITEDITSLQEAIQNEEIRKKRVQACEKLNEVERKSRERQDQALEGLKQELQKLERMKGDVERRLALLLFEEITHHE